MSARARIRRFGAAFVVTGLALSMVDVDSSAALPRAYAAEAVAVTAASPQPAAAAIAIAAPPGPTIVRDDLTHLVYTATEGLVATVLSPSSQKTITGELAKVEVATVSGAGVELVVGGTAVPLTQLGSRSSDAKTGTTTYTFYGVRFAAGPNTIACTALGAGGLRGETKLTVVYGSGAPATVSGAFASALNADGVTPAMLVVRTRDAWNHPARGGSMVRLSVRSGGVKLLAAPAVAGAAAGPLSGASAALAITVDENGEGRALVVPGTSSGDAGIAISAGDATGEARTFVGPFLRKAFVVGLISVGAGAAPGSRDGDEHLDGGGSKLGRVSFFATGESLRGVATTIGYDTASRSLSAAGGPFVQNPGEDPYRTYGDASAQREDVLSQDRLYARLESGRNAFTYGRFNAETGSPGGASAFQAVLGGARLDLADANGRTHLTAFTARNDVAFARDVIPATGLSTFGRILQPNIVIGSDIVTVVAVDPRTGAVASETALQRNVDYLLDAGSGTLRFITVVLPYDDAFRPQAVVVRYQYAAVGAASRTTGGRLGTTFARGLGELNVGYVNDATGMGSFSLLQENVRLATRFGNLNVAHVASSGAVPGATLASDGQTWHADYAGQRGATKLVASYDRASAGFADPFGGLTAAGLTDARVALTQGLRRKGELTLGYDTQRDALSGNAQSAATFTLRQPISQRLAVEGGFDLRHTAITGSDAVSTAQARAGAEYLVGARTRVRAQRIARVAGGEPAIQPGETTLSIDSTLGDGSRVFARALFADAAQQSFATATSALASSGATRRVAVGIERRLGAATTISSEYGFEHTPAGGGFTSSAGVREALALSKQLKGTAYLQTSTGTSSVPGATGSGFTAYGFDLAYATSRFHATTSLQERAGTLGGTTLAVSAAGALSPDVSLVGDLRAARSAAFNDTQARVGLAWRPHGNDRGAALVELERRNGTSVESGEHVDTLSAEAAWRATPRLELDGRAAVKLDGDGVYAAHSYLVGLRAVQRIGSRFDVGAEARLLGAPGTTMPRTGQFAIESGMRLGDAMRVAVGYNVTGSADSSLAGRPTRKGAYITLTSVVSRVFGWGRP
ncbi:MAG: hypothetical protein QOJ39_3890 [Candidatus Eremiobacteraeota bacterium]|nr:hypothetical protein [Candidatus Eremiobacteraeota bacterium]